MHDRRQARKEREDLAQAVRHISEGEKRLAEQQRLIEQVAENGQDTAEAEKLAWKFEENPLGPNYGPNKQPGLQWTPMAYCGQGPRLKLFRLRIFRIVPDNQKQEFIGHPLRHMIWLNYCKIYILSTQANRGPLRALTALTFCRVQYGVPSLCTSPVVAL